MSCTASDMCPVSPSLQNLLLAKPLGLLSLLDEQSAFPQVCVREETEKILWGLIYQ